MVLLLVMVLPFGLYSARLALDGPGPDGPQHLFAPGSPVAVAAIRGHMLAGAWLSVAAALQLIAPLRRGWPVFHRWNGRVLVAAGMATGLAGLVYIALRGTIGGPVMSLGFAAYGAALILSGGFAWRAARQRAFEAHRGWALRFFVLAIASWLYRVHYGLWEIATGGAGRAEDFSGLFDRVNIFAFWIPYLVLVELWLRWRPRV